MAGKTTFNKIWSSRVFWIVVSIVLSFLIWVFVTMNETEPYVETFNGVQVVFTGEDALREAQGLIVTEVENTTVSVTLSGPRRVIGTLKAADIQAVIDLSTITRPGTNSNYYYSIQFLKDVDVSSITVDSQSPRTISFTVDRLSYKNIPVEGQFNGSVAEGYVANVSDMTFDPETIRISGPEEEIANVEKAIITIDRQDVDSTIQVDMGYTLVDGEGNPVNIGSMTVDTETVNVTFPVNAVKTVPLTLDILHGAGTTDANVRMDCEPSEIQISGDAETLKGINRIVLGNLDLTEFESTYENTYTITLPNDVVNESGITEAKVTIRLVGLATKRLSVTNIVPTNVPEGYTVDVTTQSIDVTIRAPEDIIDEISSSNLRAVLDLSDYTGNEGQYTVPADIKVDGFADAGAVLTDNYSALVLIERE